MLVNLVAGTQLGGWMQRIKDEGRDPAKPVFSGSPSTPLVSQQASLTEASMTKPGIDRSITVSELEAHQREGDPWFAVKGQVSAASSISKTNLMSLVASLSV